MKINHTVNNTPAVVPTKDATLGPTCAAGSSPAITAASSTTHHTGDSPSPSVQQAPRQVGSSDFDAMHVKQVHSTIQNGTLKVDAGKITDATLSDMRSLLSARSKEA